MPRRRRRFWPPNRLTKGVLLLLLAAGTLAVERYRDAVPSSSVVEAAGEEAVLEAFSARRSGVMVEIEGRVDRLLADDDEGSRHQRFIVRLPSGHTVLVSHNIDLARRVPAVRGDAVTLRGQYEWNDRGGVVHWTHHDPAGRRPGGWVRHGGEVYR